MVTLSRALALAATIALSAATLADAQTSRRVPASPVVYTGAIVATGEHSVQLKTKSGVVTVQMKPGWTVSSSHPAAASAVKPGDFIASNNLDIDDNTGKATELRIFEPGYRPEYGSHPMPTPGYSMTHALVAASAVAPEGQRLTVTFPAGSRRIIVPPGVKVLSYTIESRSLATPGTVVTAVTRKDPDGVSRAGRLLLVTK